MRVGIKLLWGKAISPLQAYAFVAAVVKREKSLIVAIAAIVNHFTSHTPHPLFGLKVGLLLILCALACGLWANYNRPANRG